MADPDVLADRDFWQLLDNTERFEIRSAMRARRVARGEALIKKGSSSDTLFIVNFGLFEVRNADDTQTVAEIGAGQLIGEMGFFAGLPRTASVIAARDSEVLEIDRTSFDRLVERHPQVQRAIAQSLAKRLARLAAIIGGGDEAGRKARPRVIAIIAAGSGAIPAAFVERLRKSAIFADHTRFLTSADVSQHFGSEQLDRYATANWLADIERAHDNVICIADDTLSDWTQTSLRSADQLMIVGEQMPDNLNAIETFALDMFPAARRHLVRLHARRTGAVQSTQDWLRSRDVFMMHHVAMQDDADFHSLARFMAGRAIGFVGGAGGAFGSAHVGILKAFAESGIAFDICGGSSIGAIVAAAFAMLMQPDDIDALIHAIFVRRRAMQKRTLPRYSIIDHTVFDRALQEQFGSTRIEDLWKPYFAVATDLSTNEMRVIRRGPVWQAIRASCALPGSLPPFFDDEGHMLVDGGVIDNAPVDAVKALKAGPNVVVDLRPLRRRTFDFKYQSIPGRWQLLAKLINPLARRRLPRCPGPSSVTLISMFANLRLKPLATNANDVVLRPPPFPGSAFMNFSRHRETSAAAYAWGVKAIAELRAKRDPPFAAMEHLS